MNSGDGWGDDVYQPDGSEIQDDAGLLDAEDTLESDGVADPLDRGWSPPERPWAVEHYGVTAAEQHEGETLDQRLAEELPDLPVPDGDDLGDSTGTDGELLDSEVGEARSGGSSPPTKGRTRTRRRRWSPTTSASTAPPPPPRRPPCTSSTRTACPADPAVP